MGKMFSKCSLIQEVVVETGLCKHGGTAVFDFLLLVPSVHYIFLRLTLARSSPEFKLD